MSVPRSCDWSFVRFRSGVFTGARSGMLVAGGRVKLPKVPLPPGVLNGEVWLVSMVLVQSNETVGCNIIPGQELDYITFIYEVHKERH